MFSGPDQQTPISIPISADLDDNLENTKEENNYIKRSIMELRTIRNVRNFYSLSERKNKAEMLFNT